MVTASYSEEKLFELGKTNYDKLVLYCHRLEENGFWEQAEQVMKQSSTEVLDLYVQSVLMNLAVHCGRILEVQRDFVCAVTATNPLGVPEEGNDIPVNIYSDSRRLYELPPILLQLCGLYDKQNHGDMTEYFLDSFLNILLCMAYLDKGRDEKVTEFIELYYAKISNFLINRTVEENAAYIEKKLSSEEISCDVEWLRQRRVKTVPSGGVAVAEIKPAPVTDSDALEKPVKKTDKKKAKTGKPQISDKEKEELKKEKERKAREEKELEEKRKRELEQKRLAFFERVEEEARLAKEREELEEKEAKEQFMLVKQRIKEREQAEQAAKEKRMKELMDELYSLVGLDDVKQEIQSLTNLIKIRQLRAAMNMPLMDMSYHMVFTGSPGTGKTTVARLVGKIYKELGILSDGKMIETDRSGLVAGYVGQTAIKVHEIVEQAIGGVLFIDEAYSLVNPDVPNDFGGEAVDTLVKLMEDHRDNLVIIVAGYTEEMKTFLRSNTGLISRFNKFIDFPDYKNEELIEIMGVMASEAGLKMEDAARQKVLENLCKLTDEERVDFGNARGIRNVFEKIVMNQANRLVQIENPTKEQLMSIIAEDVQ